MQNAVTFAPYRQWVGGIILLCRTAATEATAKEGVAVGVVKTKAEVAVAVAATAGEEGVVVRVGNEGGNERGREGTRERGRGKGRGNERGNKGTGMREGGIERERE